LTIYKYAVEVYNKTIKRGLIMSKPSEIRGDSTLDVIGDEFFNKNEYYGMYLTTPSITRIGFLNNWFKKSMDWVDEKTGSGKIGSKVGVTAAAVQTIAIGAIVGWALLSIAKELPFVGKWVRAFEAKYNAFFMKNVDAQLGKNITRGSALAITAATVFGLGDLALKAKQASKIQKFKENNPAYPKSTTELKSEDFSKAIGTQLGA
jgi:hypothetical protein